MEYARGSDVLPQYTALSPSHYVCIYFFSTIIVAVAGSPRTFQILGSAMVNSFPTMPHSQPSIKGDFNTSYTAANISKSAAPYDSAFFDNLKVKLNDADPTYLKPFSYALLVLASNLDSLQWQSFNNSAECHVLCSTSRDRRAMVSRSIATKNPLTLGSVQSHQRSDCRGLSFHRLAKLLPACFGLIGGCAS